MIHTSRFDGTRCGGALTPYRRHDPELARCEECGQVGVPCLPPKTRSRPGRSLSDSAKAASV